MTLSYILLVLYGVVGLCVLFGLLDFCSKPKEERERLRRLANGPEKEQEQ